MVGKSSCGPLEPLETKLLKDLAMDLALLLRALISANISLALCLFFFFCRMLLFAYVMFVPATVPTLKIATATLCCLFGSRAGALGDLLGGCGAGARAGRVPVLPWLLVCPRHRGAKRSSDWFIGCLLLNSHPDPA